MKIETDFDIGDCVTIIPVKGNEQYPMPRWGWGFVKERDIGVVREIRRKRNYGKTVTEVSIDFPSQSGWIGMPSEVVPTELNGEEQRNEQV